MPQNVLVVSPACSPSYIIEGEREKGREGGEWYEGERERQGGMIESEIVWSSSNVTLHIP